MSLVRKVEGRDWTEFFERLVDAANGAAYDYDHSVRLDRVNGASAWVTDFDDRDDDEEHFDGDEEEGIPPGVSSKIRNQAKLTVIGTLPKAHGGTVILKFESGDGFHVIGASGVNVFRCFYM